MKILFVFHEAHLTGASLLLFNSVKWYYENQYFEMTFLLKEDGILRDEIAKIGKVYFWEKEKFVEENIFEKVKNRLFQIKSPNQKLINLFKKEKFDIIYANTIECAGIVRKISELKVKIIWHIHELSLAINISGKNLMSSFGFVEYFIANSKATKENLLNYGIDESKIFVSYPFIDRNQIRNIQVSDSLRQSLSIPENAFVIGSSGSGTVRKGIHSFIQLPLIIDYLFPNNEFYYLWIGKVYDKEIVDYDLHNSDLRKKVIFVGEQTAPFKYYNIFDVFVSCSKQESFGMSAIEAAALKKPLVCFKRTGGIEELVNECKNISVEYLDLYKMAEKILSLYHNDRLRRECGENAYDYSLRFDVNNILNDLVDFIRSVPE